MVRFLEDLSGVTAIEYGLLAGLIGAVIIAAVSTLGTNISNALTLVSTSLN